MAVNFFEIFFIGLGFGLTGPCLFCSVPLIFAFALGAGKKLKSAIIDILIFLSARFLAYVILAFIAAVSGILLRKITGPQPAVYFKSLAGIISIFLGAYILFKKETEGGDCRRHPADILSRGGLFGIGFVIGISPCVPLVLLLSEIALLSKNVWEGGLYGAAFGLGTFIPAFIITAVLTGLSVRIKPGLFRSPRARLFLKIAASLVFIFFGLYILAGSLKI